MDICPICSEGELIEMEKDNLFYSECNACGSEVADYKQTKWNKLMSSLQKAKNRGSLPLREEERMTTVNRKRALGSLVQILHLEYGDYDFDVVCSGWKCWVYRDYSETDMSSKFIYLHKQARRNLLEEERQWKQLKT